MNTEHTFIVHTVDTQQKSLLKAFCKAMKIKFEMTGKSPYDRDFTDMVLEAEDSIRKGGGKKVSSEEFDNLWK